MAAVTKSAPQLHASWTGLAAVAAAVLAIILGRGLVEHWLHTFLLAARAGGLKVPLLLLVQFGLLLPAALKLTGLRWRDLGLNLEQFGHGARLTAIYYLWMMLVPLAVILFTGAPAGGVRFANVWQVWQQAWTNLHDTFWVTVLWEEVICRGLFLGWLLKAGFDRPVTVARVKLNLAVLLAAVLFGLSHLTLLWAAPQLGVATIVGQYVLGGMIPGYVLGAIRRRTGSLAWPMLAHTVGNWSEWLLPFLLGLR